jgi:hypothetical protein
MSAAAAVAVLPATSPSFAALSTGKVAAVTSTTAAVKYATADTYMYFQGYDSSYVVGESDEDDWEF